MVLGAAFMAYDTSSRPGAVPVPGNRAVRLPMPSMTASMPSASSSGRTTSRISAST